MSIKLPSIACVVGFQDIDWVVKIGRLLRLTVIYSEDIPRGPNGFLSTHEGSKIRMIEYVGGDSWDGQIRLASWKDFYELITFSLDIQDPKQADNNKEPIAK